MGRIDSYPEPTPQAPNLPITLAYAEVLADSPIFTTTVDLTGLAVTFTVPSGRRIRIITEAFFQSTVANDRVSVQITDSANNVAQQAVNELSGANTNNKVACSVVLSLSGGTYTYKVRAARAGGATGNVKLGAGATFPAFLLVEDITGISTLAPPASVPVGVLGQSTSVTAPTTASTTYVDLGVSVNVVVPEGRTLRLYARLGVTGPAADIVNFRIRQDGADVANNILSYYQDGTWGTTAGDLDVLVSPAAGAHTYTCVFARATGAGTTTSQGCFLYVEDIKPTPAPANSAPSSTLAYAEVAVEQTGIVGSVVDLTGLAVTVTVPAGRRIKITAQAHFQSTVANDIARLDMSEDVDLLQASSVSLPLANNEEAVSLTWIGSPTAGTHTYDLQGLREVGTGTVSMRASTNRIAFILVEDITAAVVPVPASTGLWVPGTEFPASPTHGDLFYEKDTDKLWVYNGAAWVQLVASGAWDTYTPISGGLTLGNGVETAHYTRWGRTITVQWTLTFGSTTTIATIAVGLPVAAARSGLFVIGVGYCIQGTDQMTAIVRAFSTTQARLSTDEGTVAAASPFTWAVGDVLSFTATYEAAASV